MTRYKIARGESTDTQGRINSYQTIIDTQENNKEVYREFQSWGPRPRWTIYDQMALMERQD